MQRFLAKVNILPNGCWDWTASTNRDGYALFYFEKLVFAHRWIYERVVGHIPAGRTLDHTCHTDDKTCELGNQCPHRRCVNPAHLEPVTAQANIERGRKRGMKPGTKLAPKTHCKEGHPLEGRNLFIGTDGRRRCRKCRNARRHASENAKAYDRRYARTEKRKTYVKAYREANREEGRKYQQEYFQQHKAEIAARQKTKIAALTLEEDRARRDAHAEYMRRYRKRRAT